MKKVYKLLSAVMLTLTVVVSSLIPCEKAEAFAQQSTADNCIVFDDGTRYLNSSLINYHNQFFPGIMIYTSNDQVYKALGITDQMKTDGMVPVFRFSNDTTGADTSDLVKQTAAAYGASVGPAAELYAQREGYGWAQTIWTLDAPIQMILAVPEIYLNKGYDFAVGLIANDTVTVLKDLNTDKRTVVFETNQISTIVLLYGPAGSFNNNSGASVAPSTASTPVAAPAGKVLDSVPKTGDTIFALYFIIVSGLCIGASLYLRYRYKHTYDR